MFDAKKAKEIVVAKLEPDSIYDGVIIMIEGTESTMTVKDLLKQVPEGWKGNPEDPAIQLNIEVKLKDDKLITIKKIMTYYKSVDGDVEYHPSSNLSKYRKKYGDKLPEVGDVVKVYSDKDGFGKIKLD